MIDWLNVEIEVGDASEMAIDVLSGELYSLGAQGLEIKDQEAPTRIIAAFEASLGEDEIDSRVASALQAAQLEEASYVMRPAEQVDWSTHWRKNFSSMPFGPLWVVPSWLEPPEEAQLVLRLDPGRAFGTGNHETTALCLERLMALSPIPTLLDVGTGSGILALGALLAGAKRVVGTDNDPEALACAEENAAINGLEDRLELSDRNPDQLGQFSVVVANILWQPLIDLAPAIASAVEDGGSLLLSGILSGQADAVGEAYRAQGLEERSVTPRGEWVLLEYGRPA